jgi:hypothetical protein
MHTVIETPTFLSDCRRAGLSEDARLDIVGAIADDPLAGDVITGTGGARKRRFAGHGKGKSGGYGISTSHRATAAHRGRHDELVAATAAKGGASDER